MFVTILINVNYSITLIVMYCDKYSKSFTYRCIVHHVFDILSMKNQTRKQ